MSYKRLKTFNGRQYVYEQKSERGEDGKFHTRHVAYHGVHEGGALGTGTNIEAKEHPTLSKEQAEQVAKDHLAKDPNAYNKEPLTYDKKMINKDPIRWERPKNQDDLQKQYFQGRKTGTTASTGINGNDIYSYGTVIGVKQGKTFYLNTNKYSVTTSKQQYRLEAQARRAGYNVVRVNPSGNNSWASNPSLVSKEVPKTKRVPNTTPTPAKLSSFGEQPTYKVKLHTMAEKAKDKPLTKKNYHDAIKRQKEYNKMRDNADATSNKKSISQIRAESKDYFWSPDTMRFYRQARATYTARYDPATKTNYVRVNYTPPETKQSRVAYYKVVDGKHETVDQNDVPDKAR